jgi:uncharacterized sporulation protein YeaH/YhbH (DUF444 family)
MGHGNMSDKEKLAEENNGAIHSVPEPRVRAHSPDGIAPVSPGMDLYGKSDLVLMQAMPSPEGKAIHSLSSIDELLQRDKQREEDGFPRKIRIGRLVKPGRGAKEKIILVPTTVEEKFIHDTRIADPEKEGATGGSGEGKEGDVIGEEPIHDPDGSGIGGAGQGEGAEHELESSAYDLGKILSENFELPDLKDKGKKRSLTRYTYDLTDRNQGCGQVLDKKATLRKIIESNIALNNIGNYSSIDPGRLLVSPKDKVYRILSKEKEYESQAMVFFVRDYSGSMVGKPTELVVTQHVLIYSWLLYQYEKQVETRFILHDTEAKEVPDFYTYYNSSVAGGTKVQSAYRLVNDMVEEGNLARDYNIYVFHGTDGDDWDDDGTQTIPELKKMLTYSNRVGVTIAERGSGRPGETSVEKYLRSSRLLEDYPRKLRLDTVEESAGEGRLIEGIRSLIS